MSVDLSIVIVNFNSAHFLYPLIDSIRSQVWTVAGRPGRHEIIVVDNASKGEDMAQIEELALADDVVAVCNTMNVGYGQANNQGFAVATGRYHMILNPDTAFLPGCIAELVGHLEMHADSDMVGPLAYMDPAAQVMMPPNEVPTPDLIRLQTRAQTSPDSADRLMLQRTRFAFDYWSATEPLELGMLSGSCVVYRRSLFQDEYPFDPGFPLYYEDTDMFLRLRRRAKKLLHLPKARMYHYWSQSAGTHARGAQYRERLSARRYYRKHFGDDGLEVYEQNHRTALETKHQGTHIIPLDYEHVEAGRESPVFRVDPEHQDHYYIEFAGNPIFTLAVGMFPETSGDFTVSQVMWDQLGPGDYWIRMIDRATLETLRAWVVTKRLV
ncbi:MAG: glycosyltransferase family 2 protein [Planctomycetes bacterium]|nr:glycosyltransferase family 2 protein [Planctomycetota bacterium]